MLGLTDPWIGLVFALCLASSLLCVIYGAINWNRGDEAPDVRDGEWVAEEDKLESEL